MRAPGELVWNAAGGGGADRHGGGAARAMAHGTCGGMGGSVPKGDEEGLEVPAGSETGSGCPSWAEGSVKESPDAETVM